MNFSSLNNKFSDLHEKILNAETKQTLVDKTISNLSAAWDWAKKNPSDVLLGVIALSIMDLDDDIEDLMDK